MIERLIIAYQILQEVRQLHAVDKIVHGDLKAGNIMIKGKGADIVVKLVDFDFAAKKRGTVGFAAPEVVRQGKYSKKSDIYAIRSLLYAINEDQLFKNGQISSALYELFQKTHAQDPEARPEIDQLISGVKDELIAIRKKITNKNQIETISHFLEKIDESSEDSALLSSIEAGDEDYVAKRRKLCS